eukprot:TRINITY_DN648_c0_g1_i2.p1 TRINITY_DN648_c0_g1~~TRINITY_DN648_c0_g1_i2.p1  ORF type:complete len:1578 (+),score=721.92 TRINITY_DN648_c0_g1_i2:135-4868(+)
MAAPPAAAAPAAAAAAPAPAAPARKRKTLEQVYQKKTQLEHILIRPDTYIGSIEPHTERIWVWDEKGGETGDGEMVLRDVTFVPGLYKIFDEILVNAADNKERDPSQSKIRVDISVEQGSVKVWNNGEGIPVQIHKEHQIYVPDLIFGHLLTGSNYDDDEKKTTGGRNGYGAKLANIFSTKFQVETQHRGRRFKKVWRKNMGASDEATVKTGQDGDDFTAITFWPDFAKFQMAGLDADMVALMQKRVYDVAGNTPRDLRVYLNGKCLPVRDFEHYVDLFPGMGEEKKKDSYASPHERWQICVRPSNIDFQQISFVNSIWTIKGGKHVDYIVGQVVDKVTEAVKKKHKKLEIKPHMVKQFLWIFVNARIENPAFDSQTKETLNTLKSKFGSKCEVPQKMIDSLCKVIAERVTARANDKLDRQMAAKVAGAKSGRIVGIPKLEDANDAGGKNSRYCTLILTEGDSAKALVLAGMSEIGRDRFGVFPLRGKLLNVREAPKKQILENKEIQALTRIIGLKVGHTYNSVDDLRYGCVMIMTDQDTDGSHIKGLLINFFHTFWPSLLQIPGFLVQFITPVVKAFVASKRRIPTDGIPFYNIPDMLSFKAEAERGRKKYDFKYYKGLGSSDNSEAKQYFSQLSEHRIEFLYDRQNSGGDDQAIKLAFAKDQIENRKHWITGHSPDDQGVDFKAARRSGLTYKEFINKDLIWFSVADCERSIPHVLDGLKPAQRKALWSCFRRNLTKEIRVSQLTGYVSEKACYHHGEVSMQGTIAGMAQDFVGSNNLPFLVPCGMFGSRHVGGKDCASARYIHTKLAPSTRVVFNKSDDFLLNYKDDDGTPVEPEWYIPVLPTVLINGCAGIGTGFATSIPNFNPLDIVENVRRLIRGEEQQKMIPWYRGHTGEVKDVGQMRFLSLGKVVQVDRRVVRITELPVKYWTEDFQKVLDEMQEKGFISCYRNHTTSETIDIDVGFHPDVLARIAERPNGLYEVFGLTGVLTATNLVCFDKMGRLKKYPTPEAILEEWYYVRLEYYGHRKRYLIDELKKVCEKLQNMVRFIREVNDGKLVVQKRKKKELLAELRARGYKGFPPQQKLKLNKQSVQEEPEPEEEADPSAHYFNEGAKKGTGDEEEELTSHYDYLLSMRIWSLTYERARFLEEQLRKAEGDLAKLESTTEKSMWLDDLSGLEQAVRKANAEWQEALGKDPSRGGGDGALPAKGKRKKKVEKARLDAHAMRPQTLNEQQQKEVSSWLEKLKTKHDAAERKGAPRPRGPRAGAPDGSFPADDDDQFGDSALDRYLSGGGGGADGMDLDFELQGIGGADTQPANAPKPMAKPAPRLGRPRKQRPAVVAPLAPAAAGAAQPAPAAPAQAPAGVAPVAPAAPAPRQGGGRKPAAKRSAPAAGGGRKGKRRAADSEDESEDAESDLTSDQDSDEESSVSGSSSDDSSEDEGEEEDEDEDEEEGSDGGDDADAADDSPMKKAGAKRGAGDSGAMPPSKRTCGPRHSVATEASEGHQGSGAPDTLPAEQGKSAPKRKAPKRQKKEGDAKAPPPSAAAAPAPAPAPAPVAPVAPVGFDPSIFDDDDIFA